MAEAKKQLGFINRFRKILEDHFYVISVLELRSNGRFDFTISYLPI